MSLRNTFKTIFSSLASMIGMNINHKNKLDSGIKHDPRRVIHFGKAHSGCTTSDKTFTNRKTKNRMRRKMANTSRKVNRACA